MRIFDREVVILLMSLLCWQTCLAQVDPWEKVRLIEQGKRLSVKLYSGKSVNGKLEAWNSDGLDVRRGKGKVVPLAKADIAQVAMVIGMSRGRKAMWAGVVSGVALGGIAAAACASPSYECDVSPALILVVGAAFYGGIAAGIAALFPPHKEVIYTAQSAVVPRKWRSAGCEDSVQ